ncbi:MAG TPA: AbrB family transcriptional regulator, partial [Bacillales bacterium]|nr:AbrB family transcriptional regulator [Bacillales bacterium]
IPALAGLMVGIFGGSGLDHAVVIQSKPEKTVLFSGFEVVAIGGLITAALGLAQVLKIPAAPFLYAMLLAFLFNQFVFSIGVMPNIVVGFGQVLLGAIIGLSFDRTSLIHLKDVGWVSLGVLFLFLILGLLISIIFFLLTPIDYITSLLSMVPGGAPYMASTATLLHLDATMVASVQLIRLLVIFLLLPIVIPYMVKSSRR